MHTWEGERERGCVAVVLVNKLVLIHWQMLSDMSKRICCFVCCCILSGSDFDTKGNSEKLYLHIKYLTISIMISVFTNGLGDQGSISGRVIPKTQKMVLDVSLLNTQHFKVWIKGKWSNSGKGVVPSSIPWCRSYWKESLWVALDKDQSTYI